MITNERQYRISRQQLNKFQKAIQRHNIKEASDRLGSEILAVAELDALRSEFNILADQINEYEALKAGKIKRFEAENLDELPEILIRARIAQQLTQKELGEIIGVKEQQIQRYEAARYEGASLRRLNEIAHALNLNITKIIEVRPLKENGKSSLDAELDWSKFPTREMYTRGWFENFTGTLKAALDPSNHVVKNYIENVIRQPAKALHRKQIRSGSNLDEYALLAWECRVITIAMKKDIKVSFNQDLITDNWISGLVRESYNPDGVPNALAKIEEVGIAVVIEPHLAGTFLDGAGFLYKGKPIIGLTLRYDRLDNFWFALLHEIGHLKKHLKKGILVRIFDDFDTRGSSPIESEADDFARESLIPSAVWDKALCRFLRTEETIQMLADEIQIDPSIIAGRIRFESNNYTLLNSLVGQGKVRKFFPSVEFGT